MTLAAVRNRRWLPKARLVVAWHAGEPGGRPVRASAANLERLVTGPSQL